MFPLQSFEVGGMGCSNHGISITFKTFLFHLCHGETYASSWNTHPPLPLSTNIHDLTFVSRTRMPLHLARERNQQPKTQHSITSFGSLHNQWVIAQRVLNLSVCNWSASKVKSQHPWCRSHSLHALLIINDLAHKAQLVKHSANFKIFKLQLKKRKTSLLYPRHYYGPPSYLNTTYFWTKCWWCKRLEHIGILKPKAY